MAWWLQAGCKFTIPSFCSVSNTQLATDQKYFYIAVWRDCRMQGHAFGKTKGPDKASRVPEIMMQANLIQVPVSGRPLCACKKSETNLERYSLQSVLKNMYKICMRTASLCCSSKVSAPAASDRRRRFSSSSLPSTEVSTHLFVKHGTCALIEKLFMESPNHLNECSPWNLLLQILHQSLRRCTLCDTTDQGSNAKLSYTSSCQQGLNSHKCKLGSSKCSKLFCHHV